MTHIITQNCCNDSACVPVCPVNCIHPTPDEPDYATAEILYIDPAVCIDCGACVDACPVSAIYPDYELPEQLAPYAQMNADYFADPARAEYDQSPTWVETRTWAQPADDTLRVAIVGSGPAASYAAEELLGQRKLRAEVDMFERLPTPGGLVRYGVAPDHQKTKDVSESFGRTMRHKAFRLFSNVEIGRDLTHEQLTERYHAVVYAVGAMSDRSLGIPGELLQNSHSATEFVGWYNGHPDFASRGFDLSGERAVILGNGNVALDVARILLTDVEALRTTDIAAHALDSLANSNIKEVVVVGRRGPAEAAFTTPELLGLFDMPGVDVIVAADEVDPPYALDNPTDRFTMGPEKNRLLSERLGRPATSERRITLRFLASPVEILGDEQVSGVRLVRNDLVREGDAVVARATGETEDLACDLVFRSVGYRGRPVDGLPFDEHRSVLPHVGGRVMDPSTGEQLEGVYATGWIKRGPSGVIGTNKKCAKETVTCLLEDYEAGQLTRPTADDDIANLVPDALDLSGWRAIDAHERAAGREQARPRLKIVEVQRMLEVARDASRA
jgi:ferredoxin--NADP+ reductase